MKTRNFIHDTGSIILLFCLLLFTQQVSAQVTPTLPDTARMTYNQISKTCGLYVFPSKGQSQEKQKQDEFECYQWAVQQSGIDPLNLPKVQAAPTQTGPDGSMVMGGAKGAAAGVAIGAIAGNAGEGAAIGAVVGGLMGIRRRREEAEKQEQQSQQAATQTTQNMKASFVKAFSACMDGKGYTLK